MPPDQTEQANWLFQPVASHHPAFKVVQSLETASYFKLIAGASFTEARLVSRLASLYTEAGCNLIDLAPDPDVFSWVLKALEELPSEITRPALMISLDVDGDPHFRKVTVDKETCIVCQACISACPTNALQVEQDFLTVNEPLCYGCARCLPTCPVDSFSWKPSTQLAEPLLNILGHPAINGLELHTETLNFEPMQKLLNSLGKLLPDKLISWCFRPKALKEQYGETHLKQRVSAYLDSLALELKRAGALGLMLQVDGKPMSGSEEPEASHPALEAALEVLSWQLGPWPITISGGVNAYTARFLQEPHYQPIAGAAMGTMARKAVWHWLKSDSSSPTETALQTARQLVNAYQPRRFLADKWTIMKVNQPVIATKSG